MKRRIMVYRNPVHQVARRQSLLNTLDRELIAVTKNRGQLMLFSFEERQIQGKREGREET